MAIAWASAVNIRPDSLVSRTDNFATHCAKKTAKPSQFDWGPAGKPAVFGVRSLAQQSLPYKGNGTLKSDRL